MENIAQAAHVNKNCCSADAQCSHDAAIDVFIKACRLHQVEITNSMTNDVLWGFPLDIPSDVTGIFNLQTDDQGVPQTCKPSIFHISFLFMRIIPVPPESWPMEVIEVYPSVDNTQFPGRNINNMVLMGQRTDGSEITLALDQPDPDLGEFWVRNPLGEVIVILTEQPRDQW